jgi:hypothetical protein
MRLRWLFVWYAEGLCLITSVSWDLCDDDNSNGFFWYDLTFSFFFPFGKIEYLKTPKETVRILRSTHLKFSAFPNQITQNWSFLHAKFICLQFEVQWISLNQLMPPRPVQVPCQVWPENHYLILAISALDWAWHQACFFFSFGLRLDSWAWHMPPPPYLLAPIYQTVVFFFLVFFNLSVQILGKENAIHVQFKPDSSARSYQPSRQILTIINFYL